MFPVKLIFLLSICHSYLAFTVVLNSYYKILPFTSMCGSSIAMHLLLSQEWPYSIPCDIFDLMSPLSVLDSLQGTDFGYFMYLCVSL